MGGRGRPVWKNRKIFPLPAKELDTETGYYYFGARYYDPKVSMWISTDPAIGKYLPTADQLFYPEDKFDFRSMPGIGGVYNSVNLNVYHYAGQNPVKLVDPDGRAICGGACIGGLIFGAIKYGPRIARGAVNLARRYGPTIRRGAVRAYQWSRSKLTGSLNLTRETAQKMTRSANTLKGKTSAAGHALSKHAQERPDIWGKLKGNQTDWKKQALKHVKDIIRGPGKFKKAPVKDKPGRFFWEKRLPDGRGVRFQEDLKFKGFIE